MMHRLRAMIWFVRLQITAVLELRKNGSVFWLAASVVLVSYLGLWWAIYRPSTLDPSFRNPYEAVVAIAGGDTAMALLLQLHGFVLLGLVLALGFQMETILASGQSVHLFHHVFRRPALVALAILCETVLFLALSAEAACWPGIWKPFLRYLDWKNVSVLLEIRFVLYGFAVLFVALWVSLRLWLRRSKYGPLAPWALIAAFSVALFWHGGSLLKAIDHPQKLAENLDASRMFAYCQALARGEHVPTMLAAGVVLWALAATLGYGMLTWAIESCGVGASPGASALMPMRQTAAARQILDPAPPPATATQRRCFGYRVLFLAELRRGAATVLVLQLFLWLPFAVFVAFAADTPEQQNALMSIALMFLGMNVALSGMVTGGMYIEAPAIVLQRTERGINRAAMVTTLAAAATVLALVVIPPLILFSIRLSAPWHTWLAVGLAALAALLGSMSAGMSISAYLVQWQAKGLGRGIPIWISLALFAAFCEIDSRLVKQTKTLSEAAWVTAGMAALFATLGIAVLVALDARMPRRPALLLQRSSREPSKGTAQN